MVITAHDGLHKWTIKDVCFYLYPHSPMKFLRGIMTCEDSEEKSLWFEIIYDPVTYKKEKAIEEIKDQIALKNLEYPNWEYHVNLTKNEYKGK